MNLAFEILSDTHNELSKKLGIAYFMKADLIQVYENFQIDLETKHGNDAYMLPIPATYVVDAQGIIRFAHFDVDYTSRLEPENVLTYL